MVIALEWCLSICVAAAQCPIGSTGIVPGTGGTGGRSGCSVLAGYAGTVKATAEYLADDGQTYCYEVGNGFDSTQLLGALCLKALNAFGLSDTSRAQTITHVHDCPLHVMWPQRFRVHLWMALTPPARCGAGATVRQDIAVTSPRRRPTRTTVVSSHQLPVHLTRLAGYRQAARLILDSRAA